MAAAPAPAARRRDRGARRVRRRRRRRARPSRAGDVAIPRALGRRAARPICGIEGQRHDWPEREVEGARTIAATLDELGALDAVRGGEGALDVARFRRTLEAELDTRLERVGQFGTGVLVGHLGQAYAADLDAVYVLGTVEGVLPPRGREDPLLPDRERRDITGLVPRATRRLEERRDYLAALAAGAERVLTFPRADPRAQRKRLPARWVLESARHLAGADLSAEELRDARRRGVARRDRQLRGPGAPRRARVRQRVRAPVVAGVARSRSRPRRPSAGERRPRTRLRRGRRADGAARERVRRLPWRQPRARAGRRRARPPRPRSRAGRPARSATSSGASSD